MHEIPHQTAGNVFHTGAQKKIKRLEAQPRYYLVGRGNVRLLQKIDYHYDLIMHMTVGEYCCRYIIAL